MKLSICVPHYNEPWEVCKHLFDTISVQDGINFDDIEVLVGNDGLEKPLFPDLFKGYPYKTEVFPLRHRGVSATRNSLLKEAKGDYVMFCDCDDGFAQTYGLHLLFARMKQNPDVIISSFIEEGRSEGGITLIRHDNDMQFVHGKAYNRQFLLDKDIWFDEELLVHEDGYFNNLVGTEGNTYENIENPFYTWRWNSESVARKDSADYFLISTYPALIKMREAVCRELKARGFVDEYYDAVAKTLIDAYYEFQMPITSDMKYCVEINEAFYSVKAFFKNHMDDYANCHPDLIAELMHISRQVAFKRGMKVEHSTLTEFLDEVAI